MSPALANWIKAQEEDKRKHAEKMAIKNSEDDKQFLAMMKPLLGSELKQKERIMLLSMLRFKKEHKNWSPAQRSVIANLFYKHISIEE